MVLGLAAACALAALGAITAPASTGDPTGTVKVVRYAEPTATGRNATRWTPATDATITVRTAEVGAASQPRGGSGTGGDGPYRAGPSALGASPTRQDQPRPSCRSRRKRQRQRQPQPTQGPGRHRAEAADERGGTVSHPRTSEPPSSVLRPSAAIFDSTMLVAGP